MFFFFISSIISYTIYDNDPPVVLAYKNGEPLTGSLLDLVSSNKENLLLITISKPVRKSTIQDTFAGSPCTGKSISTSNTYVYPHYPDFPTLLTNYASKVSNVESIDEFCQLVDDKSLIIIGENVAENSPKAGYSNPFTPGVWNCFFFIIFTISFVIWAMIHYANIDVQTKFAKKLY